jgi:hypothetical protein
MAVRVEPGVHDDVCSGNEKKTKESQDERVHAGLAEEEEKKKLKNVWSVCYLSPLTNN